MLYIYIYSKVGGVQKKTFWVIFIVCACAACVCIHTEQAKADPKHGQPSSSSTSAFGTAGSGSLAKSFTQVQARWKGLGCDPVNKKKWHKRIQRSNGRACLTGFWSSRVTLEKFTDPLTVRNKASILTHCKIWFVTFRYHSGNLQTKMCISYMINFCIIIQSINSTPIGFPPSPWSPNRKAQLHQMLCPS